ncbi:hypothetical protein HG263_06385 [Pseudoalteromonas sp. JBTF-M23]|uniref:Uncharacterized protein n=1 Tax=Pseudoalteromonas caenipelagi TaxID=2726988 RepID=A0A849VBD2_9GAMM|nr:hypothetical protein [Pseudoalteromonas caenipelagi]NOU50168.1 hypothetical protein [Pseudoalteromonas caenipelagi]
MINNLKGCALAIGLLCTGIAPIIATAAVSHSTIQTSEIREQLNDYFADTVYAASQMQNSESILAQLEQAQAQVATMTELELKETYAQMQANADLWSLPDYLLKVAELQRKIENYKSSYNTANTFDANIMNSLGTDSDSAEIYEQYDDSIHCVDFLNFIDGVPFAIFTLYQEVSAGLASIAADGIANILSPSIVTVAAGNGGGVPNPVKATAVAGAQALKVYWQAIKWYRQTVAECKGKLHRKYLYEVVGLQQADHTPKKEVQLSTEYVDREIKGKVHDYYFIVHAKLDGKPVDVRFVSAKLSDETVPVTFVENADRRTVTLRNIGAGLYELKLSYNDPDITHPRKMQLVVEHIRDSAKYGQTVTHTGVSFSDVMN